MLETSNVIFEYSPWWILVSLLLGGFYAFMLYRAKAPWSRNKNLLLAGCRFLVVMLISLLFLEPQIKTLKRTFEKPIVLIGLDNSSSVEMASSYDSIKVLQGVLNIKSVLEKADFEVITENLLSEEINLNTPILFDVKKSPIGDFLSHGKTLLEGRNHAFTIMLTDGITNSGKSPAYVTSEVPLHIIGLGDTVQAADLSVLPLKYNKIAYQGNKFSINAEITNAGFVNKRVSVSLKRNGKMLQSRSINLTKENQIERVTFILSSGNEGSQKYSVEITSLKGEVTYRNNRQNAYLDIIKGKQKILIAASSAHPDIKTLQAIINKNQNYETTLYVEGVDKLNLKPTYDLVICHQCFPNKRSEIDKVIGWLDKKELPVIHILGNQFSYGKIQKHLSFLKKKASRRQNDLVSGAYNSQFSKFRFDSDKTAVFRRLPPLSVPYGSWQLSETTDVLLYQQIGSATTDRPLIVVNERNERKQAVIIGAGLWMWRMHELALEIEEPATELLIRKLIQYVSAKNDKRRLRVYPTKKEYFDDEKLTIISEMYNDSYEPVFNIPVSLSVRNSTNQTKSYSYTPTESNLQFHISDLEPDTYSYYAQATIGKKNEKASGQFTIKELDIEALRLQADHQLLRKISRQSGGSFHTLDDLERLVELLKEKEATSIIHTHEEFEPLIRSWILMLIIALIACTEWFFRKYLGKY